MKRFILLIAGLSLAGLSFGDTIVFKDNIELGGPEVEVLSRKGENVKVKVKYGTVTLKANRIASITIQFDTRVKNLVENGNDTANNFFNLGVLCDQSQMPKEAAEAYTLAIQAKTVPEEMLKRLAEVFEKRQMWHEAKAAYDRLLLTNPADAALQKKAAFCGEMAKDAPGPQVDIKVGGQDPDDKDDGAADIPLEIIEVGPDIIEVGPDVIEVGPDGVEVAPDVVEAPQSRDSLEANGQWKAEQWGNNATCEVVVQGDDNKLLSVTWTQRDKEKVAVRLSLDIDLTDKTKLTMDVYNDSATPAGVGMAFNTLPGYQFFESLAFNSALKKWTSLEIDLTRKKFKCAASNWRYTADIANKDNVKDIFLLIYNRAPKGTLFVDNIRFHTAGEE